MSQFSSCGSVNTTWKYGMGSRFGLFLQPLSTPEPLAVWTMAIAAGVRHEGLLAAVGTLILMATQRRRVTGGDGAKNLPVMDRQTMSLREARQRGAHNFAQGDRLRRTGPGATGHRTCAMAG